MPGLFVVPSSSSVQRKENAGSWVFQQPQRPVNSRPVIQPKAHIHAADDHFEKEADRVADKVVSGEKTGAAAKISRVGNGVQRKCASCEQEEKKVQAMHIQRKCSSCEAKEKEVQAKTSESSSSDKTQQSYHATDSSPPVNASSPEQSSSPLDQVLSSQSTRGSPLPEATRQHMEAGIGADFGNVRVHTGQDSHAANQSIGAKAFTQGNHIHFASGQFNPSSKEGKQLLAHELVHTVQQGAAAPKPASGKPGKAALNRKVRAVPKKENKKAKIPSPHDNAAQAVKDSAGDFSKKFKGKKPAGLPASLLKKQPLKNPKKEKAALPGKEKKKQEEPVKGKPKSKGAELAKNRQQQLQALAGGGIQFKPDADKEAENNPAQKIQKSQSKNLSEGVLKKAALAATAIYNSLMQVRPRLTASATKEINRIKANETAQKTKIETAVKTEKAAAKKAMQQAAGSINAFHKKSTGEIKAAATKARGEILAAKILNTVLIQVAAITQIPKIDKAYADAKKDFEAQGRIVGNECSSSQNQRSWTEFKSKMIHEDDNIWDGPYTDDMKEARGNAAEKVGDMYKESMTNAGVEQAKGIDQGKPNDIKKVNDSRDEMLKGVNSSYDTALKAIDEAEKSGIKQADGTKKSMLASVGSQHKAAQASLDTTKKTQLQLVEILAKKQTQQVELQAAQAIEAMEEAGGQNLDHLNNGFKEYKQVCESMNSPPPAQLQQTLTPIEKGLAQTAPAMNSSLQKGMQQTGNGFTKTATDTIGTTNSTVDESLAAAKLTNSKAIDGLKKLQSAAITSLQGNLTNTKKTITSTATQCVKDIQKIKTDYDTSLTNIQTDLTSGLKTGSEEFKKGLQQAVNQGTPDNGNKSMRAFSQEQEQEAADKCEPRWKSVVKVLIIIAVTLVVALVVGPAVIGFISAAAGGGAFGAAVGAVVGGAILGAGSSAVITISNNLLDGKSWHEGVGKAMLEGAVTGAIGGAFGAAGSGIAGKLISETAKGIGPALGRFAISQTVDFAGNVVTEYASSKIQGKPFSWTAVAQGQAVGAGMHIGMGGLGSLKNVKGFKTINNIMEGSANLGGKFGNKVSGRPPPVEAPHGTAPKAQGEEPKAPAPKEEPKPSAKTTEETKAPAPKEEGPTAGKPAAEEPKPSAAPKEEPHGTAPKEEGAPGSKPKEEGPSKPGAEETKAKTPENPNEGVTPGGKKQSELPSNLSKQEVEQGVVAKEKVEDGHSILVDENGNCKICSRCEKLQEKWSREMENPDVKAEFEKVNAMPEGPDKARAAANFNRRMEERLLRAYKKENPNTKFSDVEIKEKIRAGERMNPETGLFNKPETEVVVDKHAKFETEGTGPKEKVKVEEIEPGKFDAETQKKRDQLLKQREEAQKNRDKHAEGTDKYKEHQNEVVKASEGLGNNASEGVAKQKGFDEPPKNVGDEFRDGAGTFDRVFEKDGKYLVAESKGGKSDLGSREVIIDGEPVRVQQGTKEYFEDICRDMMKPGRSAKEQQLGKDLLKASGEGKVDYILVNQPVSKDNVVGNTRVKTFKQ